MAECEFFAFWTQSGIVVLVAAATLRAIDRTTRQAWTCRFAKDNRWG
jgi:hypothetical protein